MAEVMGEPEEPQKFIYLVRHGETALNAEKRLRGWSNPPLNDQGHEDAKTAAEALQPIPLDEIYISDLRRAMQTAATIVGLQTGQAVEHIESDLRPIDFGQWNGKLLSEVEPKMHAIQERWKTEPDKEAPGGESWSDFQGRQLKVWKKMLASRGEHVAMVAHLRNCTWAICYALTGENPLSGPALDLPEPRDPGRGTCDRPDVLEERWAQGPGRQYGRTRDRARAEIFRLDLSGGEVPDRRAS